MKVEQLKLENQICFPIYAASRLVTRAYQVYLDALGITYPQYLVMMVLWERDGLSVNEIAQRLILNTNTITPLLKRMETIGLLERKRSKGDERKVNIYLTETGKTLQLEAASIPIKLLAELSSEAIAIEDLMNMKDTLCQLIDLMLDKKPADF
jgi:DNA-binding MarR family transcriptional regulator